MRNCKIPKNKTARRLLPIACAALTMSFTASLALADQVTQPPVPTKIQVPAGNKAFLKGHATGTQNYICLPDGTGFKFVLFTPQATLFDEDDKQIITHFFGPNPDPAEPGAIRAAWQYRDTSTVWGGVVQPSSDPNFVDPDAIPWLLIERKGSADGPTGGHKLTGTTFIQRVNTSGGVAPETDCETEADVGGKAFVPYTADYFFYKKARKYDDGHGNY
ncbi:MAG: DUF3455 domain-containing protein [Methylococcaceae bacterium]|nr:DUF3455 domain-containing protein [Methylococcaceae bacterium]